MEPWAVSLFISAVHLVLAGSVSAHIVLTKPDVRAAIGWVGLVWLTPVVGSVLYALFGINRIRRQAGRMRRGRDLPWTEPPGQFVLSPDAIALPDGVAPAVRPLATLVGALTGTPLVAGNAVDLLVNGDEAYPAMLAAIDTAAGSIALATYIFNRGHIADQFIDALARAVQRGVAVRVLIDGVGARYSHPPIAGALRAHGIAVARFLPPTTPWRHPYFNLRNHRKLMVVDGTIGFCGGLNIQDGCVLGLHADDPIQDLHFRVRGPVVGHVMKALAFDWTFATREELTGPTWFPPLTPAGAVLARGISDGPDEDYETLLVTILGALSQATRSIRIVTPYFLPDATLIDALRVAALRGVQVDILLPARGNLRFVEWAATAQLSQIMRWGCRVHLSPPPFDHSKLFLIDGTWCMVGS
ncbi:MAG TPA: phospholipase D-like domain-containing protein, partial [Burkholderiales bacterium]|nr:phospholipase D-like domain-containing protein [Burkholderiales bacterium]